jgi:phosphoenolpyruvate---glycerone phosphotransferase subunit DhaL
MSDTITGEQILKAFELVTARLIEMEDDLNQLDAAMGDGDTGITVAKGAIGVRDWLRENPPGADLAKFISGAGMAFNRAAPSTIGALTATALMRAGKEAKGMKILDAATLARMVQAADEGIQERGKAKPGDKTIVDALHPAALAFANEIATGANLNTAARAMLRAARQGRDDVIPLRSKIGRAGWVGERTEGQPDPGTVLFVQVLETILEEEYSKPGGSKVA